MDKELYRPSAKQVVVVEVPEFQLIQVDGQVEPGVPVAEAPDYRGSMEVKNDNPLIRNHRTCNPP